MQTRTLDPELFEFAFQTLTKMSFLAALKREGFEKLCRQVRFVEFAPHEQIAFRGEPALELFLVMSGTVVVKTVRKSGEGVFLGELPAPLAIGEIGLLSDRKRTANVFAKDSVQALQLNKPQFKKLFEVVPGFGWAIAQGLANRVDELSTSIAEKRSDLALFGAQFQ